MGWTTDAILVGLSLYLLALQFPSVKNLGITVVQEGLNTVMPGAGDTVYSVFGDPNSSSEPHNGLGKGKRPNKGKKILPAKNKRQMLKTLKEELKNILPTKLTLPVLDVEYKVKRLMTKDERFICGVEGEALDLSYDLFPTKEEMVAGVNIVNLYHTFSEVKVVYDSAVYKESWKVQHKAGRVKAVVKYVEMRIEIDLSGQGGDDYCEATITNVTVVNKESNAISFHSKHTVKLESEEVKDSLMAAFQTGLISGVVSKTDEDSEYCVSDELQASVRGKEPPPKTKRFTKYCQPVLDKLGPKKGKRGESNDDNDDDDESE